MNGIRCMGYAIRFAKCRQQVECGFVPYLFLFVEMQLAMENRIASKATSPPPMNEKRFAVQIQRISNRVGLRPDTTHSQQIFGLEG